MLRAATVIGVCGGLLGGRAHGSPRSDPTAGRAVFTGAATANATSIDLNPAALGLGATDELYVAGMAVVDQIGVATHTVDLANDALVAGPHVRDAELGPGGMLAYVWHVADGGTLGLQLRAAPAEPFASDRDALALHTLGGHHGMYGATLAASIRVSSGFFVGISLADQATYVRLRYARDTALAAGRDPARGVASDCGGAPCGLGNPAALERYDVTASTDPFSADDVLAANLGVAIELGKDMWLGVAYHTPPGLGVENELKGEVAVTHAPRDGGDLVTGKASVIVSQPASADAELRMRLPRALDLHVGAHWEDLSRLAAYDVRTYGAALAAAGVPEWTQRPRGFHDPVALWGGVEQVDAGERWRLGARLGVETSSLEPSRTSPDAIAPTSMTADVGAQLRLPFGTLQVTYGLQYFPTVHVPASAYDPRDRLACEDSGYDYSTPSCAAVRGGYAIASGAGDYDRIEHAIRIGLRYER